MKELIVVTILIFVSLSGSRLSFFNRKISLGFKSIMFTGTEYILIGILLGNSGFQLIDSQTIKTFNPFLMFGLSAIGFLFGLQFNKEQLKKIPRYYFIISFVESFITFLTVSTLTYVLLGSFLKLDKNTLVFAALIMGSFSSTTAQSALAIINQNYRFKNIKKINMLRYISSIDGFYAICFFILSLSIFSNQDINQFSLSGSLLLMGFSIFMGIIPAIVFIIILRTKITKQEFFAILVGTVLFTGGISLQIHYSPLIAGFVSGILIANFCKHSLKALSVLIKSEKSFYIILLVFMGAMWNFDILSFIAVVIYLVARTTGKALGSLLGLRMFCKKECFIFTTGFGLLSEGGISIAILMSFSFMYPNIANPLISILVISVFINELLSPYFILKQFGKDEIVNINIRQKIKQKYPEIKERIHND